MDVATGVSLLTLAVISSVGIAHEALHMYCAQKLGYNTRVSLRFFKKIIPYAVAVNLEKDGTVLNGRWNSWGEKTQSEYNTIAVFPYLFIIPFCVFLLLTKNPILVFWSTGITLWHFCNYPLEWVVK